MTKPGAPAYLPYSLSADGETLVMGGDRTQAGQTIITLSLKRDGTPTTVFRGARGDIIFSPTLSPDGKWLAYEWRHENHHNIYVDPFPPTGVHHQVTTDGGSNPMWSTDGKRLFYVREADREGEPGRATFHAVNVVRTDTSFEHGKPIALFSVDRLFIAGSGPGNIVDLAPDGKKFVSLLLSPRSAGESRQGRVNVVLNWVADLKERTPPK